MPFFTWESKFIVLVPAMDEQHKKLVELVNNFHDASKQPVNKATNQKLLDGLINYTVVHFTDEEKFMESIAYPAIREHKMLHKALVARALEVKSAFEKSDGAIDDAVLNFLKSWLMSHIAEHDKKYGLHAKDKKAV